MLASLTEQRAAEDARLALSADADDLASQYSAALEDSSGDAKTREASLMFSVAEEHVQEGEGKEGSLRAEEALTLFRQLKDEKGEQDSLRLLHLASLVQGKLDEAAEQASAELSSFKAKGDKRGEASMLLTVGEVALARDESAQALKAFAEALELFKAAGDKKMAVRAALATASAHLKKGIFDEALQSCKEAMSLAQELGDAVAEGKSSLWLAICSLEEGSLAEAAKAAAAAVSLLRANAAGKLEALALELQAEVFLAQGLPRRALRAAEQALRLCSGGAGEGRALRAVVRALLEKGESKRAQRLAQQAATAFQQSGSRAAEAAAQGALATVCAARHCSAEAIAAATKELQLLKDLGDRRRQAGALLSLASLNVDCGQTDAALAAARQAGAVSRDLGDRRGEAAALFAQVAPQVQSGSLEEARSSAQKAREAFQAAGDRRWEARALLQLAVACAMSEEPELEEAVMRAQEAAKILQELGDLKGAAEALLAMADFQLQSKLLEEALGTAEETREMCRSLDHKRGEAAACERLARNYLLQGEPDRAAHLALEAARLCRKVLDKRGESYMLQMLAEASLEKTLQASDSLQALGEASTTGLGKSQRLAMVRAGNEFCKKAKSVTILAKWMGDKLLQGNALLFLAQAQLLKNRIDPAIKAATEAEALFASCEEQVDQLGGSSPLLGLSLAAGNLAGLPGRPQCYEGPRPAAPLLGSPQARRAQASVFAAEVLALKGSPSSLEKAEEAANAGLEAARLAGDSATEDRALQLLEALYGPAEAEVQEVAAVAVQEIVAAGEPASAAQPVAKKGLDPEWVRQIVENTAKQAVAADDDELHLDAPLMESGMDSLSSVAFRNQLNQQIGMNMPAALMFDYPSMRAIIDHVVETSAS